MLADLRTVIVAFALVLVMLSAADAQQGTNSTRTVSYASWTLAAGATDTLYFSLPAAAGYGGGNEAAASLSTINPPDQVQFSGNLAYTVRLVSGSAVDSTTMEVKPLDHTGDICINDSAFAFGAQAVATTNAVSTSLRTFSLSAQFDPAAHGFAVILYNRDLSGGSRTFAVVQHSN